MSESTAPTYPPLSPALRQLAENNRLCPEDLIDVTKWLIGYGAVHTTAPDWLNSMSSDILPDILLMTWAVLSERNAQTALLDMAQADLEVLGASRLDSKTGSA